MVRTKHTLHVTADYADGTSKANLVDRETLVGVFSSGMASPLTKMFQSGNPIVCITITRADVLTQTLENKQEPKPC
jgi:hypothetical protein